ncbi:unnamed protein product [Phytophthora fragariaefolia]|uniref:Unnamed protein product n=1 Tax=Phytophthora fragariaefolia TaxID=1490495 RepID=A0A9W6TMK4_9STRA|nr:unnamed protein product [Phytophthora fragariaefolia]
MGAREDDAEPSQILDHVFLGSRTHARDKELLQRLGITHILNVRGRFAGEYGRRLQRSAPKQKAARVARGPVGPQLPPSETRDGGEEKAAASIGPQLPPHLTKARKLESEAGDGDTNTDKTAEVKGLSINEEKVAIGPSLPPSLKRQRVETTEQSDSDQDGGPSNKKKKLESDE